MQVEAILFDFDGTLADTMSNHFFCWENALQEVGVSINADDYYIMEGASLFEIAKKFSRRNDQETLSNIVKRKKQLYVDMHKGKDLVFYPGAINIIKSLSIK